MDLPPLNRLSLGNTPAGAVGAPLRNIYGLATKYGRRRGARSQSPTPKDYGIDTTPTARAVPTAALTWVGGPRRRTHAISPLPTSADRPDDPGDDPDDDDDDDDAPLMPPAPKRKQPPKQTAEERKAHRDQYKWAIAKNRKGWDAREMKIVDQFAVDNPDLRGTEGAGRLYKILKAAIKDYTRSDSSVRDRLKRVREGMLRAGEAAAAAAADDGEGGEGGAAAAGGGEDWSERELEILRLAAYDAVANEGLKRTNGWRYCQEVLSFHGYERSEGSVKTRYYRLLRDGLSEEEKTQRDADKAQRAADKARKKEEKANAEADAAARAAGRGADDAAQLARYEEADAELEPPPEGGTRFGSDDDDDDDDEDDEDSGSATDEERDEATRNDARLDDITREFARSRR